MDRGYFFGLSHMCFVKLFAHCWYSCLCRMKPYLGSLDSVSCYLTVKQQSHCLCRLHFRVWMWASNYPECFVSNGNFSVHRIRCTRNTQLHLMPHHDQTFQLTCPMPLTGHVKSDSWVANEKAKLATIAKDIWCKTFPLHDQFLCLQDHTINLPVIFI